MSFQQLVQAIRATTPAAPPAGGDLFDSDDFHLGIGDWTEFDPGTIATWSFVGSGTVNAHARGAMASGVEALPHTYTSPALLKACNDVDFTVTARVVWTPAADQGAGLWFREDANNSVVLSLNSAGNAERYSFVAGVLGNTMTPVTGGEYLRMTRTGDSWQAEVSTDGVSFSNVGGAFTAAMSLVDAGVVLISNYSGSALSVDFDWIEDSADPIAVEDPI